MSFIATLTDCVEVKKSKSLPPNNETPSGLQEISVNRIAILSSSLVLCFTFNSIILFLLLLLLYLLLLYLYIILNLLLSLLLFSNRWVSNDSMFAECDSGGVRLHSWCEPPEILLERRSSARWPFRRLYLWIFSLAPAVHDHHPSKLPSRHINLARLAGWHLFKDYIWTNFVVIFFLPLSIYMCTSIYLHPLYFHPLDFFISRQK